MARSPFVLALASGALLWAALPPLGWWPLGWVAPLGLLLLVTRKQLPGRRPYWAIWTASVIYWIVVMQGIRLAHWANYFGLLALSCYLGIYWPLFVGLARQAVHRWHVPVIVAAPVVWTGVEVGRAYGPLGFSMALLAHTQSSQLAVIQVADLFGGYAVSFVLMFVAACILSLMPTRKRRWAWWPAALLVSMIAIVLLYGRYRLNQQPIAPDHGPVRIALIQGSIDTIFEDNPDRPREMLDQYSGLTEQACRQYRPLDLVVWPETMFPVSDILVEQGVDVQLAPSLDMETIRSNQDAFGQLVRNGIRRINQSADGRVEANPQTSWLLGTSTWQLGDYPPRRYNAAIMINHRGDVVGRYYKMHPVMFGEYVPFGNVFPWLYRLMPMANGLTSGETPLAVEVAGLTLSPSICFESTMPHLIRRHVVQLTRLGKRPDVLVNLTNDGWFWGSTVLDMQLQCAVFRAVELRRPMLVAANTGLSAWIDGNGRIRARGPRRATATLLAEVRRDGRRSGYERWGDLPAGLCTLFCVMILVAGGIDRARRRSVSGEKK